MNRWFLPIVCLALAYSGAVAAAEWRMDPAGSKLAFQVSYEGEPAPGAFKQFDTRLRFDPARPGDGTLHVTVQLASIDMGSADLNGAIRAPEWLDLAKFSKAEFQSTEIKRTAANQYLARGTLQLKGVQRTVDVPFRWMRDGKEAAMAGELTLDRTAFGIGTGEWASGNPIGIGVKVSFKVRLRPAS